MKSSILSTKFLGFLHSWVKYGLTFYVSCMLADDSHDLSSGGRG